MVFGLFTDAAEAALNVLDDTVSLELPEKRDVAKLIDAGLTVAAVASALGVAEDVVQQVLDQ